MARVLYSHRIQSHDGQGIHVEAMVAALRAAGHEVRVVGPGFYDAGRVGSESGLVAGLRRHLPAWIVELLELAYSVPAAWRLAREARAFSPDLVYERYNLFFFAGAWVARRCRVPFMLEVNSSLASERAEHGTLRLRALARWCQRRTFRAADRVFAVSGVLRGRLLAETPGLASDRVVVIHNGVDPSDFPEPAAGSGTQGVVLGFVGFVREWHGLGAVIEGLPARRGAGVRLVVAGEGPATPALRARAAALGVSDLVDFLGNVGRGQVPGVLAGFDVALQPRVVDYASPLKVFEYMAAGLPVVAPDQPNVREILADGATAALFDPALPGAMWDAIDRLVADPGRRAALGAAARADVRARFTWAGNAERVLAAARDCSPRQAPGRAPLVMSVFPTFGVGGVQARFCQVASRAGGRFRHVVVSLDGDLSCRARLDPSVDAGFLAPPRSGSLACLRRYVGIVRAVRPDVVVTSNWGSIEFALAARLAGVRVVHMEDGFGADPRASSLRRRVLLRRLVLAGVTLVVPSATLKALAVGTWGFRPSRVRLVPNGVDLDRFRMGRPWPVESGCYEASWPAVVGTVAALREEKNVGRLLSAFAAVVEGGVDARLRVAGDGPQMATLRAQAAALGICDRVEFLGELADPAPFYRGLDVFALSSDTEQAPLSVLEAMASGLPVASTDVGDVRQMVAEAGRDLVVPLVPAGGGGAAARLARKLASAIAGPVGGAPDEGRHGLRVLGALNRRRAEEAFSLRAMCDAHEALWRDG